MPWLNVVLILYGLLNIVMGSLGFIEKGSVPSIISGGAAGLIVLGSVYGTKFNPRAARITALVITILLMGRFASKTFSQGKIYPDGIEFAASFVTFLCLFGGHMLGMKQRKAREATGSGEG